MAGWLLNVGRPSEVVAEGGVAGGEGVEEAGVVCGLAVGVLAGFADGVVSGVGVLAGDDEGDATDGGVGELGDCPPEGSADFCSHAMTRKLATTMETV